MKYFNAEFYRMLAGLAVILMFGIVSLSVLNFLYQQQVTASIVEKK